MTNEQQSRNLINQDALPTNFPTHEHDAYFWECLGRTVATYGFLEESLIKAIFAFTATTKYSEEEIKEILPKWIPKLDRSISDPLGGLIETYGKAVRDNTDSTITNLDDLINDLKEESKIRNVFCHGSWREPDQSGASIPFFVNRQKERFKTPIDSSFLKKRQEHTIGLVCAVINSVTHMGWQFPGSNGPGKIIWNKDK